VGVTTVPGHGTAVATVYSPSTQATDKSIQQDAEDATGNPNIAMLPWWSQAVSAINNNQLSSDAVKAKEDLISNDYQRALARQPDADGFSGYMQAALNGASNASLLSDLAHSAEARNDILGHLHYQESIDPTTQQWYSVAINDISNGTKYLSDVTGAIDNTFSIYTNILMRTADSGGTNTYVMEQLSGSSISDIQSQIANSQESQGNVNAVYNLAFAHSADAGAIQNYTNAMAKGMTLPGVINSVSFSSEAQAHIQNFISDEIGSDSVSSLSAASSNLLAGIITGYEEVKGYSTSWLQSLASEFKLTFSGSGDSLFSMVNGGGLNNVQMVELSATLVLMGVIAPEAVAVGAAAGAEDLLATAFGEELNSAAIFEARGLEVQSFGGSYDELFTDLMSRNSRVSGQTLQLDENTTVTSIASTRYSRDFLNYGGANFDAVVSYFKKLTGISDLSEATASTSSKGSDLWSVYTPDGTRISLRLDNSTGNDWTIDFRSKVPGKYVGVKFWK